MKCLIEKFALVAEIDRLENKLYYEPENFKDVGAKIALDCLKSSLDTLEVKDPYEQCIQYDSIKAGIQAHAETYSFNIESELFNQLTKEQQALWKKEIEQAVVSGGEVGCELARDMRYQKNVEVKEVNLDYIKDELDRVVKIYKPDGDFGWGTLYNIATHFFELGLKVQKGE